MKSITISVLDQNGAKLIATQLEYIPGSNVQGYLETLVNISAPGAFSFGLQYYGSFQNPALGYMVIMLQGIYDAPGDGKYWSISYNNLPAQAGVDGLFPAPGTTIVFQQATYNAQVHGGTPLAAKQAYHSAKTKKE